MSVTGLQLHQLEEEFARREMEMEVEKQVLQARS